MHFNDILFKLYAVGNIKLLPIPEISNADELRSAKRIYKFLETSKEASDALDDASTQLKNLKLYGEPTPHAVYDFLKGVSKKISKLNDTATGIEFHIPGYISTMACFDGAHCNRNIDKIISMNFETKVSKIHLYWLSDKLMSIVGDYITFIQVNKGRLYDNIYYTPDMSPNVYKNLAELEKKNQAKCEDYNYDACTGLFAATRCPCDESEWITMTEYSICKGINCAARIAYYKNELEMQRPDREVYNNKYENKFMEILEIQSSIIPYDDMMNRIEYLAEFTNYHCSCPCGGKRKKPQTKITKIRKLFRRLRTVVIR
jgi:hypothetical protein